MIRVSFDSMEKVIVSGVEQVGGGNFIKQHSVTVMV